MSIESGENAGRYTEEVARDEADKMQDSIREIKSAGREHYSDSDVYKEAERVAELNGNIIAKVEYSAHDRLYSEEWMQDIAKQEYRKNILSKHGLEFGPIWPNSEMTWKAEGHEVKMNQLYFPDIFLGVSANEFERGMREKHLSGHATPEYAGQLAKKERSTYESQFEKAQQLPPEVWDAMRGYYEWQESPTGMSLDADHLKRDGGIDDETYKQLKQAAEDPSKIVLSGHIRTVNAVTENRRTSGRLDTKYWAIASNPESEIGKAE